MPQDTIHIVIAATDSYAVHASVTVQSILDSSSREKAYCIHIVSPDLGTDNEVRFRVQARNRKNIAMEFHRASSEITIKSPWYPDTTSLRLSIAQILYELDRVIYLDADTYVLEDLSKLHELSISDHLLAAAPDKGMIANFNCGEAEDVRFESELATWGRNYADYFENYLDIRAEDMKGYFNAGVMVVDLRKWRAEAVSDRLQELNSKYPNGMLFADQDLLNLHVKGKYLPLDSRWNVVANPRRSLRQIHEADHSDPWIVHFLGPKPWVDLDATFSGLYWSALMRTPHANPNLFVKMLPSANR